MRDKSLEFKRRDFLKLLSLSGTPLLRQPLKRINTGQDSRKNILILVYDAWTSTNIGQFGYQRDTMPKLAELSRKAIVYHNHHASSDFTTPGTASLLTGTLPWTHRAIHVAGQIRPELQERNIFNVFDDYYSIAYSHNVLVNILLEQMLGDSGLDQFVPFHEMLLFSDWVQQVFSKDRDVSSVSSFYMFDKENPLRNSLVMGQLIDWINDLALSRVTSSYEDAFPLGLPRSTRNTHYILEDARQWLTQELPRLDQPYLGYFHFLPPHDPYRTRAEFVGRFEDGWEGPLKPEHPLHEGTAPRRVGVLRRQYDEFMAYVDDEFAQLYQSLEASGQLENTILVLTSDHGEIFERRLIKHGTNTFYEPIMRVPLMIFDPGQPNGGEVHAPSSAIDVLPTLARMAGKAEPEWGEGEALAPYSAGSEGRAVYAATAKENRTGQPIEKGTLAIVRDGFKLVEYLGYEQFGEESYIELYDLNSDPEELENLQERLPAKVIELHEELHAQKDRGETGLGSG